ncbi:MAG: chloride channel protein, partial [Candidatus Baltobacteraceae bacterium]
GAAGGMAATFGAPVASVLLAVELLLFEWRPRSLIPVAIAAVVAEMMRTVLIGSTPPFLVEAPHAIAVSGFSWAFVIGIVAGVVSMLMTKLVYFTEDSYEKLPIHWMWWPAIGGLIVGIGGWLVPQALGVGYPTISAILNGQLALGVVAAILIVKTLIWIVSLSSGTSGGVLAPLLMIGGAAGLVVGHYIPGQDSSALAIVGMAAILGGTMRAPFTATVFALETTHAWGLLPAIFIGTIAATAFTVIFVPRSILTEKLARRGMHVAREYSVHPLELISIAAVMVPRESVVSLDATSTVGSIAQRFTALDPALRYKSYPVIGAAGSPLGLISRKDILAEAQENGTATIGSITQPAQSIHPDDRMRSAADTMAQHSRRGLLVVDETGAWVGLVTMPDLIRAWSQGMAAETRRVRVRSLRTITNAIWNRPKAES